MRKRGKERRTEEKVGKEEREIKIAIERNWEIRKGGKDCKMETRRKDGNN